MALTLWQSPDIGLLGRDRILEKEIYPRVQHPSHCFVLRGAPGIGKTALIEWAHAHTEGKSAFVSAVKPMGDIYRKIILDWDLDPDLKKGARLSELEEKILGCEGYTLYIDDLDKARAGRMLYNFKVLAQYHKVHCSISSGARLKEEHKQILVGRETISVPKLKPADAGRLARQVALHYKRKADLAQIVEKANGNPRNIVALIMSGEIPKSTDEFRSRSHEIDISPVFLLLMVGVILMRVLGRSVAASDLAAIGAMTMLVRLLVIPFLRSGKEK